MNLIHFYTSSRTQNINYPPPKKKQWYEKMCLIAEHCGHIRLNYLNLFIVGKGWVLK